MPTPPSFTQAFNGVGSGGGYATWGKLRSILYGGDYPGYEGAGADVNYLSGMKQPNGTFIKTPYTPTMAFTQPSLATLVDGGNYYLLASAPYIDDQAKDAIIGSLATFHSGDTATVTSDAFAGYPGQLLSVTTDPEYVVSLSGWTTI